MIKVNYELLDEKCFNNYLDYLISSFFKILPISENESDTLKEYLESLLIELSGNISLIEKIKYDGQFLSLLGTIQYFIDNNCTHKIYKREIFKCISILEKLQIKYK
jgi:hypothetical protein